MDELDKLIEAKLQEYLVMPRVAHNVIEKCKMKATRETISMYNQKGGNKSELYRVFYIACLKRNIKKCNKDSECVEIIRSQIDKWEKRILVAQW